MAAPACQELSLILSPELSLILSPKLSLILSCLLLLFTLASPLPLSCSINGGVSLQPLLA